MTSSSEPTNQPPVPSGANDEPPAREPVFNVPAPLIVAVGLMLAVHLLRVYVLSDEMNRRVILDMAFIPARYLHAISQQAPLSELGYFLGPVGYSLLHGSWLHLIFNSLWLVVFAAPLVRRIGAVRFTILWITSAAFSAFFFGLLSGWTVTFLIGASGVVSATVGAACRFSVALSGSRQMRFAQYAPRLGIIEALTHRSVLTFASIWLLSNVLVLFGIGLPPGETGSSIAWQSHLGGFLFGYLAFALFDPPIERR